MNPYPGQHVRVTTEGEYLGPSGQWPDHHWVKPAGENEKWLVGPAAHIHPTTGAAVDEPAGSILDEANQLVHGPRRNAYGHPKENFRRIVTLWNAWMDIRQDGPLTGEDQAAMMILLKLARLAETPDHRDSMVDIAGYAATWEMLGEGAA